MPGGIRNGPFIGRWNSYPPGGLWPLTNERFFFAFRPILVSPIGTRFFSARAVDVLGSEICWVGLPSLGLAGSILLWRWFYRKEEK